MREEVKEYSEDVIDLGRLFFELIHRWWIIVTGALVGALLALIATIFLITPMYTANTSIYVMNRQNESSRITSADLSAASQMTNDFEKLITSRTMMQMVIDKLGLSISPKEMEEMITIDNPVNTRILNIAVTSASPKLACDIANAIAECSQEFIVDIVEVEKVNIVDTAEIPQSQTSPSVVKNVILGFAGGMFAVIGVLVILCMVDDKIHTAEDAERYLGVNVIGIIPTDTAGDKNGKKKRA